MPAAESLDRARREAERTRRRKRPGMTVRLSQVILGLVLAGIPAFLGGYLTAENWWRVAGHLTV